MKPMQYHSESDIQEAYGWEFISERQYERYLELFRQGRKALDEHSPTVTELALSILNRIFQDIDRDCRQCEFEALSPEEQLAELKRAEESRQAWIIAEDAATGRRLWITQEGTRFSISIRRMDEQRRNYGPTYRITCENRTKLAQVLRYQFESKTLAV